MSSLLLGSRSCKYSPLMGGTRSSRRLKISWTDVWSHNMWRVQPPLVDESDEELTHRLRRQQVVPALGLAEARKVNGKEVRVLRKRLPDRQERIQALRPGIRQQNRVVLTLIALG